MQVEPSLTHVQLKEWNFCKFTTITSSVKGTRSVKDRVSSKGINLIIFGAIGSTNDTMLTECHIIRVDKLFLDTWLTQVMEKIAQALNVIDVVFVIDKAPCRDRIDEKTIFNCLNSRGTSALRSWLCSASIDSFELLWNTLQGRRKTKVSIMLKLSLTSLNI